MILLTKKELIHMYHYGLYDVTIENSLADLHWLIVSVKGWISIWTDRKIKNDKHKHKKSFFFFIK